MSNDHYLRTATRKIHILPKSNQCQPSLTLFPPCIPKTKHVDLTARVQSSAADIEFLSHRWRRQSTWCAYVSLWSFALNGVVGQTSQVLFNTHNIAADVWCGQQKGGHLQLCRPEGWAPPECQPPLWICRSNNLPRWKSVVSPSGGANASLFISATRFLLIRFIFS